MRVFCVARIYEHIYGNCEKKELNFQKVVEQNFGHKKLVELINMVHNQSVTMANAKQIMMNIIDGDQRMPKEIAEDHGFVGGSQLGQEVIEAVSRAIIDPSNAAVIEKIVQGNERPVMSLVGKVMKAVNRKGDPVVIKQLLLEGIAKKAGKV